MKRLKHNSTHSALNAQQQAAVMATEGRVRVVAGAGTGKTRVVAHRYAHLVNDLGIDPANILCMTFTNKAAQEMRLRIGQLVDRGNVNDFVCTIHGFCVKFLRREIFRLGYPATFSILDETDSTDLAKQAFDELHIERKQTTVRKFLDQLGRYKFAHREQYIEQYLLPEAPMPPEQQTDVLVRHLQLQLKYFSLDFDDLQYFTIYILHHFSEARDYWLSQLDYIMVDEVQDCSRDDWEIVDLLAGGQGNLCIVGDPDQSIYEWRGAVPAKLVNFAHDTDVVLSQNYRSTPQILAVANQIIAHNRMRVPKDLFSQLPAGPKPLHYHARDSVEEARFIVGEIKALTEGEDAQFTLSDCAVLYRASYLSRPIEQALLREHINYSMWGGVRFFERREIKDCIAYLHLIAYLDDFSLLRVINVPSRRFGKRSVEHLKQLAAVQQQGSLWDTLATNADDPKFAKSGISEFVSMITECRGLEELKVSDMMELVLNRSGLKDSLRNDEDEERLENVNELIGSMRDYEKDHEFDTDQSITSYLRDVALLTNADYRREGPSVKLMTIHQAKGLEFGAVWVCGLTEGVFPSHRTIRERKQSGEEEERRLMYVAVTRAKSRLYLTESEGFNAVTQATRYPSRYFCEVEPDALQRKGKMDPQLLSITQLIASELADELGMDDADMAARLVAEPEFKPGDLVRHKAFGSGVVLAYVAEHDSYRVSFGGNRERSIVSGFLEPDTD